MAIFTPCRSTLLYKMGRYKTSAKIRILKINLLISYLCTLTFVCAPNFVFTSLNCIIIQCNFFFLFIGRARFSPSCESLLRENCRSCPFANNKETNSVIERWNSYWTRLYRKISWFVSVSHAVIYSPLTNHGAPSRPITVNDVCVAMTTNRRCPQDTTMEYTYYPTESSQQLKMRSFRFFNDYDVVYFHCELLACYRYSYNSRYVCEEV